MNIFKNKITDYLQTMAQAKRFHFFKSLIENLEKPISILDLGGTINFWERMDYVNKNDITVLLLNLDTFDCKYNNFKSIKGDARNLKVFKNDEFDIVFSNSVIEHVGNFADQMSMASEVRRVGKRYFIQSPYYWFPIEPHYRAVYFQLYPLWLKVFKLQHFPVHGRFPKMADKYQAIVEAESVRLLTVKELNILFPDAKVYHERFLGLTKSTVAYKGF